MYSSVRHVVRVTRSRARCSERFWLVVPLREVVLGSCTLDTTNHLSILQSRPFNTSESDVHVRLPTLNRLRCCVTDRQLPRLRGRPERKWPPNFELAPTEKTEWAFVGPNLSHTHQRNDSTIGVTLAMEAGISDHVWTIRELREWSFRAACRTFGSRVAIGRPPSLGIVKRANAGTLTRYRPSCCRQSQRSGICGLPSLE
jgi:hypothetical protein